MADNSREITALKAGAIGDDLLFERVTAIIENRKARAGAFANQEVTLMYWEVGKYIGSALLGGKRGGYGKQIVVSLAQQLQEKYGSSFEYSNLRRMMQFAARFPEIEIVVPLAQQLSWSHFIALLPLKSDEMFMYYARDAVQRKLGKRELRRQISRKAYERREISNAELTQQSAVPFNVFKDPYLLDVLGLRENFLEADLEKAILVELESFILEFGHGFSYIERQKRMTMDGSDFRLDLLFYHRGLKRLVAVELKLGKFKPLYKGQMEFYLRWLDKYERKNGENAPIGLILCTEASRDQIELMEMDKAGIAVASYWTDLPPKIQFEQKIREIYSEAKERLERRETLVLGGAQKEIHYFIEPDKGDGDDDTDEDA